MSTRPIVGIYTALITPFIKADGEGVREDLVAKLLESQIRAGVTGVILGGSTGEGATLHPSELKQLFEIAQPYRSKIQIWGAIGVSSLWLARERLQFLLTAGVDGILLTTPPYNKAPQRGLLHFFESLAAETPESVDLMIYNIPGRSALNIAPETIKALWKFPHIRAVKESSGNLEQIAQLISEAPKGKVILCGDDPLSLTCWKKGARGTVSVISNILPSLSVKQWKAFEAGDNARALEIEQQFAPFLEKHLFCESNPIPVKYTAETILKTELELRAPLVRLDSRYQEALSIPLRELLAADHRAGSES